MINILTRRACLRNFTTADTPAVQEILLLREQDLYAPYDTAWPTAGKAVAKMVQKFSASDDYIALCQRDTGRVIGLGLTKQEGPAVYEIGIILHPEFQRLGYSVEISRAFIHYAFRELHADHLTCGTAYANTPAFKLIEYLGFRPVWIGMAALRKTAQGKPLRFLAVRFSMSRAEWQKKYA